MAQAAKTMAQAATAVLAAGLVLATLSCATSEPFDSSGYLRQRMVERVGDAADQVTVPYQLPPETLVDLSLNFSRHGSERFRAQQVLDFINYDLGLSYRLSPTQDARGTLSDGAGNCLSFANLFVGLTRLQGLNSFYVEVDERRSWRRHEGRVVSQGHIAAGVMIDGQMQLYEHLPGERKRAYRRTRNIDDLTATAHFYNNLGAEALFDDDLERAEAALQTAASLDPTFTRGLNNLGVCQARQGELEAAAETYRKGLEIEPGDIALLSNLARAYQQMGRHEEAEDLLSEADRVHHANPFFFIYRGDRELDDDQPGPALEHYRQALRLDSELPEVHSALARGYIALGERDKACHHLARALRLDATSTEARNQADLLGGCR